VEKFKMSYEELVEELTAAEADVSSASYMGPLVTFVIGIFTMFLLIGFLLMFAAVVATIWIAVVSGPAAEKRLANAKKAMRLYEGAQRFTPTQ
jgi:hypothetical protein